MLSTLHSRRNVLTILAVSFLIAAGCGNGEDTQAEEAPEELTSVRWAFDWLDCEGGWAPFFWGQENGYFAEEGVEVQHTGFEGSAAAMPLIAAGNQDMGQIQAPIMVLGAAEELPVTAVGVLQYESPLVVLVDGRDRQISDLEGLEIAVQHGEFETAVWQAWTQAVGVDRSEVTENPAGGQAFPLFSDGRIDGFIWYYPSSATPVLTDHREGDETIFPVREDLEMYGLSVAVHNDFLEENPDAVRGFLRAWARGMKYTIDNPEESLDLIMENCEDADRSGQEFSLGVFIDFWTAQQARDEGLFSFREEGWLATRDVLVEGNLMGDLDISDLYTTDFLPDEPIFP